ncbi:transcription factor AP-4-like isoform X1 [Salmo trutta]|uniref:transcription factor AP-4-like isoform X1 n=1 Tax=Salmo trutta TaxID=8032 RepID=UPI001131B3C3|nr:transcription factor AP-4-like isoform X1 [Salmo trutta]
MEYFMVPAQKVPSLQHFRKTEKEVIGGLCSLANIPLTPETARDQERRIRREIANSNERRRMQSINSGFQSLKTLIPHSDGEKLSKVGPREERKGEKLSKVGPREERKGEKLSKAAILQQTAEYIFALEQEKTRLLQQNSQLKRFIQEFSGSSPKRRRGAEEKDEGIGSPDILEEEKTEDLRREMVELRQQLDKERSVRMMLEEHLRQEEVCCVVVGGTQPEHVLGTHSEQQERASTPAHSPQVLAPRSPPAPTHHPTVIVPAPPPHHVTVVTMGPASVINTASTSRQNLDTIVQAIQHIESIQERVGEEEQRRAVIVTQGRALTDTAGSDTASDSEGPEDCSLP